MLHDLSIGHTLLVSVPMHLKLMICTFSIFISRFLRFCVRWFSGTNGSLFPLNFLEPILGSSTNSLNYLCWKFANPVTPDSYSVSPVSNYFRFRRNYFSGRILNPASLSKITSTSAKRSTTTRIRFS